MRRPLNRWSRAAALWMSLALLSLGAPALAQRAPVPRGLIPLDSPEGQRLLVEATARDDYFRLSDQFVTQKTQSYCGVASSVMVLNAMPLSAPAVDEWAPFHAFTQDNVFTPEARKAVTPEKVATGGMTLDQLAGFLQAQPVRARAIHASDLTLKQFRDLAAKNLADPSDYIIVNWLRSSLDQEPNGPLEGKLAGHFSPLAAYHKESDRFLVLDVARYKYPPVWVEAKRLFDAMNTVDLDSGSSRGLVVVSPGPALPSALPERRPSRLLGIFLGIIGVSFALGALCGALMRGYLLRRKARPSNNP